MKETSSIDRDNIHREFGYLERFFPHAVLDLEEKSGKWRLIIVEMYLKTEWCNADEMQFLLIGMRHAAMITKCMGIK